MKLVLLNKFEAVEMLRKDWDKPVNSDRATVNRQPHKTFYVPDKWPKGRKGIMVKRKGFKARKFYRAFPTDLTDLEARFERLMGSSVPLEKADANYKESERRSAARSRMSSAVADYGDPRRGSLKRSRK